MSLIAQGKRHRIHSATQAFYQPSGEVLAEVLGTRKEQVHRQLRECPCMCWEGWMEGAGAALCSWATAAPPFPGSFVTSKGTKDGVQLPGPMWVLLPPGSFSTSSGVITLKLALIEGQSCARLPLTHAGQLLLTLCL